MVTRTGINHRVLRWIVAFGVGFALAILAFQRISDPEPRLQRAREEAAVLAARDLLTVYVVQDGALEIVDPLATNRKVGKVYVYPNDHGWDVSGFYRRGPTDKWHPFLMNLDAGTRLVSLSVRDTDLRLQEVAATDPKFSLTR